MAKEEPPLQAVILGDVFESRFHPFSLEKPRCLLPLVNRPLIEYTLDFLAISGVQEIFISAGSHTTAVEDYLNKSRWRQRGSPFKKCSFLKSAALSVGDVMRDLDQKGLIAGDFLLVSGDIISNFPISEALSRHKARRSKDKNAIMTILLREIGEQDLLAGSSVQTFVIDPTKDRCLHYEKHIFGQRASLRIDPDILAVGEIDIRQDLFDCSIDICTPDTLSLWSDNFDNQSPRKDFLHGVLKDYELNGKIINTHIVTDHFAGRVRDLWTYDAMSRYILSRWAVPWNLDTEPDYRLNRRGFYEGKGVTVAASCQVSSNCVVGSGSSIGAGSILENSVIGANCRIGRNVRIRDAYIWGDVTIEDEVEVSQAILADNVVVESKCVVSNGALISYGSRLQASEKYSGNECHITRSDIQGLEKQADLDEHIRQQGLVYEEELAASISSLSSAESEESAMTPAYSGSRSQSFATTASHEGETDRFHQEAVPSLVERMKSGTDQDDVRVELMGLRFAQNASEQQIRRAVAVAINKTIASSTENQASNIPGTVTRTLAHYSKLIPSTNAVEFLLEAQMDLARRPLGDQMLLHLVKELYNQDVYEEGPIAQWWADERSRATEELRVVQAASQPFLDWLATAEDESEEESGEE